MTTVNSSLGEWRVWGCSPEEAENAEKARKIVGGLVKELKPILHHIAKPWNAYVRKRADTCEGGERTVRHAILLDTPLDEHGGRLFLDSRGLFFTAPVCACRCAGDGSMHVYNSVSETESATGYTWEKLPFLLVLEALRAALAKAESQRERFLSDIRERRELLDKVLRAIQRPPVR